MKKIGIILILLLVITGFFKINELNYIKQIEINNSIIKHPENLPTKETAKSTSFGFQNLRADLYWLQTIQYIGGNVISSEYKKYLFTILDLITELNPFFEHPYIIGQLLLPDYNQRYEKLNEEEQDKYIKQGINLGLKGVENFCDEEKIKLINSESDLKTLWKEEKYKNPCKTYTIPYYLAYVYYQYDKNPIKASEYYKISSINEDAPEGAKIMAAIMQGKGGNREKSFFMFLNLAKLIDSSDEVCSSFATNLEKVGYGLFLEKNIQLNGELISAIEKDREKIFGKFSEEQEEDILSDMKCGNYVNKAIREINLSYVEQGNEKYKEENSGRSAFGAEELFEKGYIDFLPTDFQQYETYGIKYMYNKETGNFDYSMENY